MKKYYAFCPNCNQYIEIEIEYEYLSNYCKHCKTLLQIVCNKIVSHRDFNRFLAGFGNQIEVIEES